MAQRLETLESRSLALHGQWTDEVLEVNGAILAIDPSHAPATNRLGIALIARGEHEKARDVFEAGVAANPHNYIAARRLESLNRPPLPPKKKPAKRTAKA